MFCIAMEANSQTTLFDTSEATEMITERDTASKLDNIDSKPACTGTKEKSAKKFSQGKESLFDDKFISSKTVCSGGIEKAVDDKFSFQPSCQDAIDDEVSLQPSWTSDDELYLQDAKDSFEMLATLKISSKKQRRPKIKTLAETSKGASNLKESANGHTKANSSREKNKSKTASNVNAVSSESDESMEEQHQIPSQIKRIPWILVEAAPHRKVRIDRQYQGEWIIYANCQSKNKDGLTKLDVLWFKVKEMVENGELPSARVSTGFPRTKPPKEAAYGSGTICCVTTDYRDVEDVKLTAKKIMDKLSHDYNGYLLYKTQEANYTDGLCSYRYNQGGSFWMRNEEKTWVLLSKS